MTKLYVTDTVKPHHHHQKFIDIYKECLIFGQLDFHIFIGNSLLYAIKKNQ